MGLFRYKAVNLTGEVLEGQMAAESRQALIERLHALGHTPIRAEEIRKDSFFQILNRDIFNRRKISAKDITFITHEMATLLHAGVTLDQTLSILTELAEREPIKLILGEIHKDVRNGSSLAESLEARDDAFTSDFISMVRAGEAGGALDNVLLRVAEYRETADTLREQVRSAMIYPLILLAMAGLSVIVLLIFVVPQFQSLFEEAGSELPLATKILMESGEIVQNYWMPAIIFIVLAAFLFKRWVANPDARLRWDQWVLSSPLFGQLIRKRETARFSRTLGTLLSSGIPLLNSLSIVGDTFRNTKFLHAVNDATQQVRAGKRLGESLMVGDTFPRLAGHLLQVGEETGKIEAMLEKTADIYDQEVKRTVERLLAILVPAITIGLGILVAGIIGSILVAILRINELAL
ncbi:MAG: type II secretion system F family protein [Rhodospirillales bacterium]|nr:type II secretion system F family protein [Rhodospirillales bacterium]